MTSNNLLLEVSGLKTYFFMDSGVVKAVDGVSFTVKRGETLGIVGESGCGKSVTSLSVMQLIRPPRGRIVDGEILYHSRDRVLDLNTLGFKGKEMRKIRGNEIAMIFQEPMTSFNPVYTIGAQIMEAIRLHQGLDKVEAKELAVEMLAKVKIPDPQQRVDEYPHQFSGGMRQRAMIAMALSCNPSLLIADEPTTALDVTIETQILELMQDLQNELGMSMMFITHDLGVVGEMADRIMVMYTGKVVEMGTTMQILTEPAHPYTRGLINSIPKIGSKSKLVPIDGSVPSLTQLPKGCHFGPRCSYAKPICSVEEPPVFRIDSDRTVKCWLYGEEEN